VKDLAARDCLTTPALRRAFAAVPREHFVPETASREGLEAVYRDAVIVTERDGRGMPVSSSSQPSMMALMLERLQVEAGHRVLEVGAGTGYNAALLAELVGTDGRVVSVELDDKIARKARRALEELDCGVRVVRRDGRDGWPRGAPYDRIVVTASTGEMPAAWLLQLREGGLLEVPLRVDRVGTQAVVTFERRGDRLSSVAVLLGGFIPLRGGEAPPQWAQQDSYLSAGETLDGRSRPLAGLRGEAVGRLSAPARRQLLSLALTEPRAIPLGVRANPSALFFFLALEAPSRRFVAAFPFPGVIGDDGLSLALLGGARTVTRVDAYGGPEAERLLFDLVRRWQARGRPTLSDLHVEAVFDNGTSRIRWGWQSG
jgi:protein-L-isoaspartate(D-aspartate) O-methyltransferase